MGLDMYLNKMPRYKNTTAGEVVAIEGYLGLLKEKEKESKYANCTLKEWCGVDESELPNKDVIDYYKSFYIECYPTWDKENEYGYDTIMEQVGYWRKANQIHKWFVEHVQDGEDDCQYHNECTKEILEELLDACKTVLDSCAMTYGKIKNGSHLVDGIWEPIYEEGKIIIDPSIAEELLPYCSGFFFGGTRYDQYYVEDIVETIKILEEVLATTDFKKEAIYYVSSW